VPYVLYYVLRCMALRIVKAVQSQLLWPVMCSVCVLLYVVEIAVYLCSCGCSWLLRCVIFCLMLCAVCRYTLSAFECSGFGIGNISLLKSAPETCVSTNHVPLLRLKVNSITQTEFRSFKVTKMSRLTIDRFLILWSLPG